MHIWPQCPEFLFFSVMEEDSLLKSAFEIRPNAPDVLAAPAEPVHDPCQDHSCQQRCTPAPSLLSANDFSIVLGSEANCQMKHSPLNRICVTTRFHSVKVRGFLELSQVL